MNRTQIEQINREALEFNEYLNHLIMSTCETIFSQLGITFFNYNQYPEGSRYLTLGTDLKWYREFFRNDLDRYFFFEDPSNLGKKKWYVIWDLAKKNELLDRMNTFNYGHGFSIFRRTGKLIEAWSFATSNENSKMNSVYLNEMEILNQFIFFFKSKLNEVLKTRAPSKFSLYRENRELVLPPLETESNFSLLKKELIPSKFNFHHQTKPITLSKREVDVLYHLASGKKVKEVASALGLSFRTIEHYLVSIRSKTALNDKSDLVKMFQQSDLATWYLP